MLNSERFTELCAEFATQAGLSCPPPTPDERGAASVHLQVGGHSAVLSHAPLHAPDVALALMDMGPLPQGRELPAMLAMLDANYAMQGPDGLSIGLAESGSAVLQSALPLRERSGADVQAALQRMSAVARGWQHDHFLA